MTDNVTPLFPPMPMQPLRSIKVFESLANDLKEAAKIIRQNNMEGATNDFMRAANHLDFAATEIVVAHAILKNKGIPS